MREANRIREGKRTEEVLSKNADVFGRSRGEVRKQRNSGALNGPQFGGVLDSWIESGGTERVMWLMRKGGKGMGK